MEICSPKSCVHTAHCLEVFSWSYMTTLVIWAFLTYCKDTQRKPELCVSLLWRQDRPEQRRERGHSLEHTLSWPRFHWTPPSSSLTFGSSLWEGRIMTQLFMTALWLQLAEEKKLIKPAFGTITAVSSWLPQKYGLNLLFQEKSFLCTQDNHSSPRHRPNAICCDQAPLLLCSLPVSKSKHSF